MKKYLLGVTCYLLAVMGCAWSGNQSQAELKRLNSEVTALQGEIERLNSSLKTIQESLERMKIDINIIIRDLIALKGGKEGPTVAEEVTQLINKLKNPQELPEKVSKELKPYGKSALVALLYALKEPNLEFRERVEKTLGCLPGKDTVEVLSEGLKDPQTRVSAARILGQLKDPAAIPILAEYITTDNNDFGLSVAEALVRLKDKRGIPMLIEYLKSDEGVHRALAIDCLSRATGKNFDYKHYALETDRMAAIKKWQKWWMQEGQNFRFKNEE